jgi:predicted nucleic acid-binding Zn ribbon protein
VAYRTERDEPRRACPTCGKVVPVHDALCTRCGTELEYPETVIEPAAPPVRAAT